MSIWSQEFETSYWNETFSLSLSQVKNHLSVACVVSGHVTILPWSSICVLTAAPPRTSAPCAWSSVAAWQPCRSTWRTTQRRNFLQTGAWAAHTSTPATLSPTCRIQHVHIKTLHTVLLFLILFIKSIFQVILQQIQ